MERLRSVLSDCWPSRRALHRAAILGATAAAAFGVTSAFASFGVNVIGGPGTYVSKRIFPGNRTASAYDLFDVSGSSGISESRDLAFADSIIDTTGTWANTFSPTRYYDLDFNSPLPGGNSTSSVSFNLRMIPNAGGETAWYYFEVRRASTNAVLGTYGSSGSPLPTSSGITGTTYSTNSTDITTQVSDTDVANDLRIRVYVKESASHAVKIDMATITGTGYGSFTLYPQVETDASTGTAAAASAWSLAAADSAQYTNQTNWPTTLGAKYLRFTFPAYVPTGAVVTSATFNHSYKAATAGDNICYYVEVYNATTLIGTHGSSTTPYACNSTSSFVTDPITLSEVDTVTEANNLVVRVYVKDTTGSRKSIDDVDTLTLNYYYD